MFWRFAILLLPALVPGNLQADDSSLTARWSFGTEEATELTLRGGVQRDQAGPKPPEFPDFSDNNTSVRLDGRGARLVVNDPGPNSKFDFTNGDAITLEAWVKLDGVRNGSPMYVIGKGRTGSPKFARDNQNWALRVVANEGIAKISFVFATAPGTGNMHWHRWTSKAGFEAGWNHVAVAYRFGEPDSIRGYINGTPTAGGWDMGGATKQPPVIDDDAIWIGSSRGGNPSNSFRGWLDEVAVHRTLLDDKVLAARFRRAGEPRVAGLQKEVMPTLADIPKNRVLVTFSEGLPSHERWLNEDEAWPEETSRWLGDKFLLPRIPLRYDDWGIRASWQAPLLVRMAADVELPPGKHRFLLRARALSRLWVDGVAVARTSPIAKQPPNGEELMIPLAQPPLPGIRVHGYGQQEVLADASIEETEDKQPRRVRVVLEIIVGGKKLRTETGEVCVAVQTADGKSFAVLKPVVSQSALGSESLLLTDAAIEPVLASIESSLSENDDVTRRQAASSQDSYWDRRHQMARDWALQHGHAKSTDGTSANAEGKHPIDGFIASKIEQARSASAGTDIREARHFHNEVLPILREQCFRCHGEKDAGGLKLNSRELVLKNGDSETPVVVPGDPEASELIVRVREVDEDMRMPPTKDGLTQEQIGVLEEWIRDGAAWPAPPVSDADVATSEVIGDEAFMRRIYLDTVGVPPTQSEAEQFLSSKQSDKRKHLIEMLLNDERCADHWMSFWLDLLAENPTLLNASLNSTGPFRWFLYDALRDNKPLDRMVTELILMRGSPHEGGSAGFALAGENDSPMAAKGHIVASAFLGIELQCARCHDSPYHSTTQRDLYSLAAMFSRKSVTVPKTSRVPDAFFDNNTRESLIRVSLKLDETVTAEWPFAETTGIEDGPDIDRLMRQPNDTRERLATLTTAPGNQRFPRVIVNRTWKKLIGAGFVEPTHDWEGRRISHPELLDWLANELLTHDYDVRHIIRLIVTSQTYQRDASGQNLAASAELRFFNAPERRRLTAEQVVDSLVFATGSSMVTEELTFVHDGRRAISNRLTLGRPTRAWMFASLNNERDRPSLALPRAQAVTDVLKAFGWTGSRQKPIAEREIDPNVLQPGVLANGVFSMTVTRASIGSELAQLAVNAQSPGAIVDALFLRVLSRRPVPDEKTEYSDALTKGFDERLVPTDKIKQPAELPKLRLVTWFNHLTPDATTIQQEVERRVRQGPPADPRLRTEWREIYEDIIWSLVNHREFVWMP